MGNQCGCAAEAEESEVKINKKQAYTDVKDLKFEGDVNFDDEQMKKVVKIQANMKGCVTRKHMKNGKIYEMKLLKEEGLEYRNEVVFEDGAVYKG